MSSVWLASRWPPFQVLHKLAFVTLNRVMPVFLCRYCIERHDGTVAHWIGSIVGSQLVGVEGALAEAYIMETWPGCRSCAMEVDSSWPSSLIQTAYYISGFSRHSSLHHLY